MFPHADDLTSRRRPAGGDARLAQQTTKLNVATIVDTAIDVADRDGLGALSMRRIADELGVGAMSLYRHVADKDTLLQLMAAECGRRFPYPVTDPSPTWRERVAIAVDVDWALYQRHPWLVLAYAIPRYGLGADCLEGLEWLADGFTQLGVDEARAVEMVLTLWNHINGIALVVVGESLLRAGPLDDAPGGGGLADLLAAQTSGSDEPRLAGLPILSKLQGRDVTHLVEPRVTLDAGVAYLCAGFEAMADTG